MDLDKLKTIHIHPRYEVTFDVSDPRLKGIFKHHAGAVLFMSVGCSHRRSTEFANDVRRVLKKFRGKTRPKTAQELEMLLWHSCRDPALRCPWRPDKIEARRIITPTPETEAELAAKLAATQSEYWRLLGELLDAMTGKRKCEIVNVWTPKEN